MDVYLLLATASLILQLIVLALLMFSFRLKQNLKFRMHGITMTAALSLHLTLIVAVMVPSFAVGLVPKIIKSPASLIGSLTPLHAAAGAITAILGLWIVGSWRLKQSIKPCMLKKKYMKYIFTMWLISLSLGLILYFALYGSLLFR